MGVVIRKSEGVGVGANVGSSSSANFDSDSLWSDEPITIESVAMGVYGDTDSGRTTLALSAPGPIAYIHSGEKYGKSVDRARSTGKIVRCSYIPCAFDGEPDQVQLQASNAKEKFIATVDSAYTWARSIVVDTHSDIWEMFQLARLGSMSRAERDDKDNKKGQLVYTEINGWWRNWLKKYRAHLEVDNGRPKTNLILIGQTKALYRKNPITNKQEDSGKTKHHCQRETPFFFDMIVRTRYETINGEGQFSGTIEKPWDYNEWRGAEFSSADGVLTFPSMMGMITGMGEEKWSK